MKEVHILILQENRTAGGIPIQRILAIGTTMMDLEKRKGILRTQKSHGQIKENQSPINLQLILGLNLKNHLQFLPRQ
jgi:hypothetical protein